MAKRKSNIIESACSCGELISIEINCTQRIGRTDGKRPFYPDESVEEKLAGTNLDPKNYPENGVTTYRCRKCGECVDETVPGAGFERAEAQEKAL
ncbi:hypothetical protein JOE25_004266 [Serratia sp. PL17]|uniref:hypothetical protein n=1 Tax=Serratia sp. PL17 TaxID=2806582 RepID=UPI001AE72A6A|nr:hypothetical protein [Serratia sp. PL17]MBP1132660.1 hypothetical protein [Serratia sp. PL17]